MRDESLDSLQRDLAAIDGGPYGRYKQLKGRYVSELYTLVIDHVQSDPFGSPSRVYLCIPQSVHQFPEECFASPDRSVAFTDFLLRRLNEQLGEYSRSRGSGNSGRYAACATGQSILARSAILVEDGDLQVRFRVGLPANGRRIAAGAAARMLLDEVREIASRSLLSSAIDSRDLLDHLRCYEDSLALRRQLPEHGLVAFLADGSNLPRRSGVDDQPLETGVRFESPASLRRQLHLADGTPVTGMGIESGVTLIVGGGYHGKSTVLRALEQGVYDHIPGDGRERIVTDASAVKIRAEDGRAISDVDISPFIGDLPAGGSTRRFATNNASGSTSQAANVVEAIESGSRLLLFDEDTSATNFMIRDFRMQQLIPKEREPITPLIEQIRPLATAGVSSILVVGGNGDYFDVADTVIAMHDYRASDMTQQSHEIARQFPTGRVPQAPPTDWQRRADRKILLPSSRWRGRHGDIRAKVRDTRSVTLGRDEIDMSCVEQLVDPSQTRGIAEAMVWMCEHLPPEFALLDGLARVQELLDRGAFDELTGGRKYGDLAQFRRYELAAALNRIRPA